MSVRIDVMLADDTRVFNAYVHTPPRVGEFLWVTNIGDDIRKRHGTTSFLVEQVAHWVAGDFVPQNGSEPIHSVAVYVKPQVS